MLEITVNGQPNSHGAGSLIAGLQDFVYIDSKLVCVVGDSASADGLCAPIGGSHCAPAASSGSALVYINNISVHRLGDSRTCGAVSVSPPTTHLICND